MKLHYEILSAGSVTDDHVNILVDIGYRSAEPEQPKEREHFKNWVHYNLYERPGSIFVIYYDKETPVGCWGLIDSSYSPAFERQEWQQHLTDNDLPKDRGVWGIVDYRFVLPEYKGKGISTTMSYDHNEVILNYTTYKYRFATSTCYSSAAAKEFTERYWSERYDVKTVDLGDMYIQYFKVS